MGEDDVIRQVIFNKYEAEDGASDEVEYTVLLHDNTGEAMFQEEYYLNARYSGDELKRCKLFCRGL